jgi:hypothetical protein
VKSSLTSPLLRRIDWPRSLDGISRDQHDRTAQSCGGRDLSALLLATPVVAQTALGTLRGVVVDEQKATLPGVTVTVRHAETNTVQSSVTGSEGNYLLPNLRPGKYLVTAELSSFAPNKQEFELRVGQDLTLNLTMKVGSVTEVVEVVGKSVTVETQSTLATIITNKQIDDLPTVARDFATLAVLSPGVATSNDTGTGQGTGISISGQRPFTNGIVVDGASNQMQFYGRQANDFPQDWIQEFQVLTNSFGAEYGQAAGGMLNVITRSGANVTNGRAYGFFRDANFDAPPFAGRYDASKNPIFLSETPPFDQQRYGGFLGGPIVGDRLFYFGGLERLELNSSDVLPSPTIGVSMSRTRLSRPAETAPSGSSSVDANINQDNRAYFRYTNTHKRDLNVAGTSPGAPGPLNPLETRQTFGGPLWNVLANWSTTLSDHAFNEFRATHGVNKPWILSNLRSKRAARICWRSRSNDTTGNDREVRVAQLSGRDLRRDLVHGPRRRRQSVPHRQLLAADRAASDQGGRPDRVAEDVHGRRSVAQGPLLLHDRPDLRHQRSVELSVVVQRQHRIREGVSVRLNPSSTSRTRGRRPIRSPSTSDSVTISTTR